MIISPEQGAFLLGRSIFENIALAQEMIHLINKPVRGGNVLIKVDMAKAYDSIDWDFLIHVMLSFGFAPKFCEMIRLCISSSWFSIVMNGTSKGFFPSGRGLRQGDPLSPYLFILVEEMLSRLLKENFGNGRIVPFPHPRGAPLISHLLYADDVIIFANGGRSSLKRICEILNMYEEWSGQVVNKQKSSIIFSKYTSIARRRSLLRLTSFSEGSFPIKYLGAPLISGRLKVAFFDELLDRIREKLEGWQTRLLSSGARLLLLRHVVSSIPVHLLSVVKAPNAVIGALNRLMSNFFWGSSNGKPKRKWIAWHRICKPISEGGVGLRQFHEVQTSLFMKFAWNLLTKRSLWVDFVKAKYVKDIHISLVDQHKGSNFWRCVLDSIPKVLSNSTWRVREGKVSFWRDSWLESGPIINDLPITSHPNLLVRECKLQDGWDVNLLKELVGENKMEEILDCLGENKNGHDVLIWKPNITGKFSSKSAWQCIRIRGLQSVWSDWLWDSALLKKYSILCWKALNHCLSVDVHVRATGISLASRCECCPGGSVEDQDHVLATGTIAKEIWCRASLQIGMPFDPYKPWKEKMDLWFRRATHSSQKGKLLGLIPIIITWSLWIWRCRARMEGKKNSIDSLWLSIKAAIFWVGARSRAGNKTNSGDENILSAFSIPMKTLRRKQVRFVYWKKPMRGWCKLNTDGSCLGNPGYMGAGGLVRDDGGNLILAFAKCLDEGTNNIAEFLALLYGLRHCNEMGIQNIEVELDSLLIVNWFKNRRCGIWYLEDYWEEVNQILSTRQFVIRHVYRESNAGADFLARMASGRVHGCWQNFEDIPHLLKGILKVEKLGLPALRC